MKNLSKPISQIVVLTFPILVGVNRLYGDVGETGTGNQGSGTFWLALQSVGALILVVIGIFIFVWLLKQMMTRFSGNSSMGTQAGFRVISRMSISPKHSLLAVRSFDDLLILASSDSGVTLLHRYENFEHWEDLDFQHKPVENSFGGVFRKILSTD